MRRMTIVVGILVTTLAGNARAEGSFAALAGIPAQALSEGEMEAVQGKNVFVGFLSNTLFGGGGIPNPYTLGTPNFDASVFRNASPYLHASPGAVAYTAGLPQLPSLTRFGCLTCGPEAVRTASSVAPAQWDQLRFGLVSQALGIGSGAPIAGGQRSGFFNPLHHGSSATPYGIALPSGVMAGSGGRYTRDFLNSFGNPVAMNLLFGR